MKYYVIAGEASGDLHGSNLIRQLARIDSSAHFRVWGGDQMENAGAEVVKHYRDLAFMGFAEVIANLPTILGNLKWCKQDILAYRPDVLILIDYPGFNLRIAEFARKSGLKVFYYISPQIWAWKKNRIHQIRRDVDEMFVILPFEQSFYKELGMDVHFEGHPLLDVLNTNAARETEVSFRQKYQLPDSPIIALLPGSRKQEIRKMLPVMLEAVQQLDNCTAVVAAVPWLPAEFYDEVAGDKPFIRVVGDTYALLKNARVAAVTSGTATLEAGLIGTPEVVCYKGGQISYWIARQLVKIKYISLVNLILDKPVLKELIQDEMHAASLSEELKALMDGEARDRQIEAFARLRGVLGGEGASARVAAKMWQLLNA